MDTDRLRRGLTISVRTVVTREWRLLAGTLLALCGYALWVGATGAAISQFASFADVSTAVDPWTGETTAIAGLVFVLWVVLPAIVATWLVDRAVTNVSDNLEEYYRITPLLLLVPPVLVLAGGLAALAIVGTGPALAVVLVAALYFQIRTLTYSYRVFSFSYPRLQQLSLFVTSTVLLLTVLVEAAVAAGREPYAVDAVTGFGDLLGFTGAGSLVDGTATAGGFSVRPLLAVAIATPLVLGSGYVCVQFVVGLLVRLRGNELPRSKLRTGQRYPEFARPTTKRQSSLSSSSASDPTIATDGSTAAASTAKSAGEMDSQATTAETDNTAAGGDSDTPAANQPAGDDEEDVTHTRVFTPEATDDETRIAAEDASGEECPFCEAPLNAGADSCDNCGASL
ncbi:zinc ribbon domain-containing protein [Halobacteriaceae archaeon SHR40]|uniref:zinc ribbon domain-containing protein n=1 Tax=Halovenus amylolytica TaxID=2500550 RepID=UPI000FE3A74A